MMTKTKSLVIVLVMAIATMMCGCVGDKTTATCSSDTLLTDTVDTLVVDTVPVDTLL